MMRAAFFSSRARLGARASGPHRAIHITQSGKGGDDETVIIYARIVRFI
jgi:hypothetical protein